MARKKPAARIPESSHPKKGAFLLAFETCGSVSAAANAAKVSRRTHYLWLANDPRYVQQFAESRQKAIDNLEGKAFDLALGGSDVLCIFLLKSLRPEVYRDRYHHRVEGSVAAIGQVNIYMPDNGPSAPPQPERIGE